MNIWFYHVFLQMLVYFLQKRLPLRYTNKVRVGFKCFARISNWLMLQIARIHVLLILIILWPLSCPKLGFCIKKQRKCIHDMLIRKFLNFLFLIVFSTQTNLLILLQRDSICTFQLQYLSITIPKYLQILHFLYLYIYIFNFITMIIWNSTTFVFVKLTFGLIFFNH